MAAVSTMNTKVDEALDQNMTEAASNQLSYFAALYTVLVIAGQFGATRIAGDSDMCGCRFLVGREGLMIEETKYFCSLIQQMPSVQHIGVVEAQHISLCHAFGVHQGYMVEPKEALTVKVLHVGKLNLHLAGVLKHFAFLVEQGRGGRLYDGR